MTLFHWDLPVELMMDGGWLSRDTAEAFADYTALVAGRLGDRVAAWMTLNEPLVHMAYGHAMGIDAPGLTLLGGAFAGYPPPAAGPRQGGGGVAGTTAPRRWASSTTTPPSTRRPTIPPTSPRPRSTTPTTTVSSPARCWPARTRSCWKRCRGRTSTSWRDGDLAAISAPLDFYGVNFYHPTTIGAAPDNASIPFTMVDRTDVPHTDFDWPVVPAALTRLLTGLHGQYPDLPPVYITENGAAYDDPADGSVHDTARIAYLDGHLDAVAQARAGRRRRARLLPLDADGQLGVGRGLHPALRPGPRRARHPGPNAAGLVRALPVA